jgi:WD40 repeat protein
MIAQEGAMRLFCIEAAVVLALSSCGTSGPAPTATGERLQASLAASWPAAGPGRQVVFSRDGAMLATSDASGLISVRDGRSWGIIEQLRHPGGATSVAFDQAGRHLFSGGYDGTVREWDLASHALSAIFRGPAKTVWTIDISPDGKRLAAAGEDGVVRVWTLGGASRPEQLRGHTRNVWTVRSSPDGTRLASGSFDDSVRLWDVASGRLVKILSGHTQAVVGLAFSPDGKLLATGADDSTIRLWRTSDGRPLRVIDAGRHVDSVGFSRDGRWLASGGHARGAVGTLLHQVTGGGGEGTPVHLWRTQDAALVLSLPQPDDVMSVAFSADGRWLVTSGEDKMFRLWRLRPVDGEAAVIRPSQ